MKTLVSIFLVTVFLILAMAPKVNAETGDDTHPNYILPCLVLGVGGVIIWGLWKICKKIPKPQPPTDDDPPAPPSTNPPPVLNPTNPPPKKSFLGPSSQMMPQLNFGQSAIQTYDVSAYGFSDTVTPGHTFVTKWMFRCESSTNLVNWHPSLNVSVFESSSGGSYWCVTGRTNLNVYFTNPNDPNNCLPVDFSDGQSEREFFRLATPNNP